MSEVISPSGVAPIFLAGPTAAGKSEVALALAELIGGEIISVDSMQVYRGMDIGTAKPGAAELRRAPHHLIDVAGLDESFDAARFVQLAGAAAADIQARGRRPIFCGGTGLYFKAYLEGLGEAPPANAVLRAELEGSPLAELLSELERTDPVTFARIDRQNPRRVVRALEVIRLTGKPFSAQRAEWRRGGGPEGTPLDTVPVGGNEPLPMNRRANAPLSLSLSLSLSPLGGERGEETQDATCSRAQLASAAGWANCERGGSKCAGPEAGRLFCLSRASGRLHERIERRVEEMFARGLVAETAGLLERGLEQNRAAMQALGYRQAVEHLRGQRSLTETVELVKIRTRQFARRQLTWFRRQMRLEWINLDELPAEAAAELLAKRANG